MADALKYSGLCETCKRDSICTLTRSTRLKIIRCEEYMPGEAGLAPAVLEFVRSRGKLQVEMERDSARITAFVCANCARPGKAPTSAGRERPLVPDFGWPGRVQQVIIPCAGRLQPEHVLKAFESGSSIVSVVSCHEDNCHYIEGSRRCARRVDYIRSILEEIGLGGKRLLLSRLPGSAREDLASTAGKPALWDSSGLLDGAIAEIRDKAVQALRYLPPNPLLSDDSPRQKTVGGGCNE